VTETAVELKVGDLVKFRPWVTQDHLRIVHLAFNAREFAIVRRLRFTVAGIGTHNSHGSIAHLIGVRAVDNSGKIYNPNRYWCSGSYLKVCYLEVYRD